MGTCNALAVILLLICPALSINIYGLVPTCGPELSYSILTINGTGFLGQNFTLRVGGQTLDPSFIISVQDSSLAFLTPKSLVPGVYPVQICSQSSPIYNCSRICTTNCTIPPPTNCTSNCSTNHTSPTTTGGTVPPNSNSTTNTTTNCTTTCVEKCILLNTTNTTCFTTASYTVYDIPAILLGISPSTVTHKTNISLIGQHFINCGKTTVRIESPNSVQDYPAWFNSSTEIVFPADSHTISGLITLSLDGQHFDSLSASPIMLNASVMPHSSSDSESEPRAKPSLIWLYVVLGVVALAAGAFLVYVIYKYKVKEDYARMYDL